MAQNCKMLVIFRGVFLIKLSGGERGGGQTVRQKYVSMFLIFPTFLLFYFLYPVISINSGVEVPSLDTPLVLVSPQFWLDLWLATRITRASWAWAPGRGACAPTVRPRARSPTGAPSRGGIFARYSLK